MQEVVDSFHELYYENRRRTWANTRWLGHKVRKAATDLWIYQEILCERRPDVIVETGTLFGGSALYLASICDLIGAGRVFTIDLEPQPELPSHPRITYLTGSSVAPEIVDRVRAEAEGQRAMAILDSDHRCEHVLAELRAYAPVVSAADYLIVEDTNLNGHPVWPNFDGGGPMEAVETFLAEDDSFAVDESREKFYLTFNPRGYLRRQS
jgi:cephalosporin hydroxylase